MSVNEDVLNVNIWCAGVVEVASYVALGLCVHDVCFFVFSKILSGRCVFLNRTLRSDGRRSSKFFGLSLDSATGIWIWKQWMLNWNWSKALNLGNHLNRQWHRQGFLWVFWLSCFGCFWKLMERLHKERRLRRLYQVFRHHPVHHLQSRAQTRHRRMCSAGQHHSGVQRQIRIWKFKSYANDQNDLNWFPYPSFRDSMVSIMSSSAKYSSPKSCPTLLLWALE